MLSIVSSYFHQNDHSTYVMVDGCLSKLGPFKVLCFGPVIVPPVHIEAFYIVENKLIGIAAGPSPVFKLFKHFISTNRYIGE